jgi:hypothetical protein
LAFLSTNVDYLFLLLYVILTQENGFKLSSLREYTPSTSLKAGIASGKKGAGNPHCVSATFSRLQDKL